MNKGTVKFFADKVVLNGKEIPCQYSVNPARDKVTCFVDGYNITIKSDEDKFAEALLAAATPKSGTATVTPKATADVPKSDTPKEDVPKSEPKEWRGTFMVGRNFIIAFDTVMEKTRIIFASAPTAKQLAILEEGAWFDNKVSGSFNKKLNEKNHAKAVEVYKSLNAAA